MYRSINSVVTLNNGVQIPQLGFGTALISKDEGKTVDVILQAIEAGYRHLDTAMVYYNEAAVGEAVRQSGIPREEFFITTKMWNEDLRQDRYREAFEESMEKLQMDYVDMYMVHWPVPNKYIKAWKEMEKIYSEKRARVLGLSAFNAFQIDQVLMCADVQPAVLQIECNPRFSRPDLFQYCKEHGIAMQAFKPLGQGAYMGDEVLAEIGKKHGKTVPQVIIRWHLQRGVIAIPKSAHKERIIENANVFDFELDTDDMNRIEAMNINKSTSNNTAACFDF